MLTNELIIKEYEALQAEKKDRMTQTRLAVWSLFFAALSGFVIAGLQPGQVAYAVAFYPLIAACLARLAGHNEAIIDRLKGYLLNFEDWHAVGYEHFNLERKDGRSGSQTKALRDVLTVTAMLAAGVVVWHLISDHLIIVAVLVLIVECVPVLLCWHWMRDRKVVHTCMSYPEHRSE